MQFDFFKYQGTGNDFVMIDGRINKPALSDEIVKKICDRRFGIGADGLIVLLDSSEVDFEMDYYNADGSQSFCGNGSRCAQAFAKELGMIKDHSEFKAIDGIHRGEYKNPLFSTKMGDVKVTDIRKLDKDWFIHTGSPHYIVLVENVDDIDVMDFGRRIRYSDNYKAEGTNVNFVQMINNGIKVRTYERGVEAETLSCGTGVTASAIAYLLETQKSLTEVPVQTRGGELSIKLNRSKDTGFDSIWLVGPAEKVYQGTFEMEDY